MDLIQKNLDTASAAFDLTAKWAKEVGLEPILEAPSK
jgi:pyruvate ferredoxin oxidoreductase gamma subunit